MQDEPGGVGLHLLLDMYNVEPSLLVDLKATEEVMVRACVATGANVLGCHGHAFGEGMGVTAVVVLSESHASIHTWPEKGLAVMDFFTCGSCNPRKSIQVLLEHFKPSDTNVDLVVRGRPDWLGPAPL